MTQTCTDYRRLGLKLSFTAMSHSVSLFIARGNPLVLPFQLSVRHDWLKTRNLTLNYAAKSDGSIYRDISLISMLRITPAASHCTDTLRARHIYILYIYIYIYIADIYGRAHHGNNNIII